MGILDTLVTSGKDLVGDIGGARGADRLLGLFEAGRDSEGSNVAPGPGGASIKDVSMASAHEVLANMGPSQRDEVGHGLLGYLRNFHHPEADGAALKAREAAEPAAVEDLLARAVRVNPRFFGEIARYLFRGAPSAAASEHGPESWLFSLLKSPGTMEFFKNVLGDVARKLLH
jgi:hypothetical protein